MNKLTKEIALQRVEEINNISRDDEMAHEKEDELMSEFIDCVSEGMYKLKEAKEVALVIKKTRDIDFARWCS